MPLYIKIDFRKNGQLAAWWSRDEPYKWEIEQMNSTISETRIRDVLIALADDLDPIEEPTPDSTAVPEGESR